ncbi:MAG: epoxyqueuosine reductase QueH [Clostridia bacterium]|nr:epoxyqueuosine reductase QueH [Clostridia bacterium]
MKTNYSLLTEKVFDEIKEKQPKPKLLLQSCCGPCSSYVLKYLTDHFDIFVYYYNPNVYPAEEYAKRLDTQKQLLDAMPRENVIQLVECNYDHDEFLAVAKGYEDEKEGGARCAKCFMLRLEKTAQKAKEMGCDFFGTTLTVSPHKNAQVLNNIGLQLQQKYGVRFLPSDFKKKEGYKQSIELSKQYDLYRQEYCGCEFAMGHLKNE